jgi:putative DNA methylase
MRAFQADGSDQEACLKRFVVGDGAGNDPKFWHLAQTLAALYPKHADEKRWVEGALAQKKSFGF